MNIILIVYIIYDIHILEIKKYELFFLFFFNEYFPCILMCICMHWFGNQCGSRRITNHIYEIMTYIWRMANILNWKH